MDKVAYLKQIDNDIENYRMMRAVNPVPGFLYLEEGYTLYYLAATWPGQNDIVEIGSFKGRSTCFLGLGCKKSGRGKVVAVDHFRGSPEHQKGGIDETPEIVTEGSTFKVFQSNMEQFELSDSVQALVGDSTEIGRNWQGSARMLFIDGEHSYQGTKLDYDTWQGHVEKGGLICFHDYENPYYLDGVTKFINDEVLPDPAMSVLTRVKTLIVFEKGK